MSACDGDPTLRRRCLDEGGHGGNEHVQPRQAPYGSATEWDASAAMTDPTTPEPAAGSPDKQAGPASPRSPRQRAAGAAGGHGEDGEPPVTRPGRPARLRPLESHAEAPASEADEARPERATVHSGEDPDAPMPAVVPRYLRADGRAGGARPDRASRPARPAPEPAAKSLERPARPAAVPFDARGQTLTAQSAALVDALTREISQALAAALRPLVASTVASLIPMLLKLGSVPDPEPAPGAPLPSVADKAWPAGLPEDGESS